MVFKDDERESNPTSYKFLQMAHAWKAKGKKALPILGGASGKADQEGNAAQDANPGEEGNKGKEKATDDDDRVSDVASSHGGDEED